MTCIYKVEATDKWGNTSVAETSVTLPDRSMPTAVLSCETLMEVGVQYCIDASYSSDSSGIVSYYLDFGDGTSSMQKTPIHTYSAVGTYTITLTVMDDSGHTATTRRTVTVKARNAGQCHYPGCAERTDHYGKSGIRIGGDRQDQ